MTIHWYAINSHTNKEDILTHHLETMGYEVYFPQMRVKPVNPRARKIVPYFPGYLFVRADIKQTGLSVFQWMPHAKGLVVFGEEPSIVSENLIQTLQTKLELLNTENEKQKSPYKPGDLLMIDQGPFKGYEAIFNEQISGKDRVRVLLKMLSNQSIPLELNLSSVRKKTE
ncbi:MAG TPA: transcription termination/antitermination NusG family protein [Bellilinea sp.]|jgi:transcriptional antiterminator RfaH|nr:transcription termination/antitermination NusG family protein [Bellilinea sp.]